MRLLAAALVLCSAPAVAVGVQVPVDVGFGPAGYWFPGPLLDNRGAVPHFALVFDVAAIIDKATIEQNWDRIPQKYRGMAAGVTEARIGPSIFIPSALYISPKVDALNGTGLYGVSWTPIGLTLVSTGRKDPRDWNKSRGRFSLDAHLLLTYLFIYSDWPGVPTTHFLRPGVQLRAAFQVEVTPRFLISLGGGGQAYVPQVMGGFGFGPFNESICFTAFTFLKFHVRFPYEVKL